MTPLPTSRLSFILSPFGATITVKRRGRIGSRGVRFAYGCQHLCHVS